MASSSSQNTSSIIGSNINSEFYFQQLDHFSMDPLWTSTFPSSQSFSNSQQVPKFKIHTSPLEGSCSDVFPLKLDVEACWQEIQMRQHRFLADSIINNFSFPSPSKSYNDNTHFSSSNMELKFMFQKKLTNSDVGTGRIVIPKMVAEANFPALTGTNSIILPMKDIESLTIWTIRYRYWSNIKSKMYVFENAGRFIKEKGLQFGDTIDIYQDDNKEHFIHGKKAHKIMFPHKSVCMKKTK